MGEADHGLRPLALGEAGEVGAPVLGHDDGHVVARRGDHRSLRQERDDPRAGGVLGHRRRAQADQRVVVEAHLGAGHEVLVATDTGDLLAVDVIGHHLPVQIDAQPAVDRHQGVVLGDLRGVVDDFDGQEGDLLVAVEPGIELRRAEGEGGTDTPSNRPLASLVTLPAWCSFIRPSVNISLWTPYPPPGLSASLEATMLGTAPMPICRVAPSVMYARAWVAMASSISSVGASGRVKGCASFSITTSTRSRGRVLVYSGGSDEVRGRLGLTSMTSRRSGSCPAMISSFMDPPTASERLTMPSASGGAAWAVITRGA